MKKTIKKTTKEAYWNYTESVITEDSKKSNNKKLWTFIKHRKTDSIDIAPLKENGLLKDAPRDMAEILNQQFSSVFTLLVHDPHIAIDKRHCQKISKQTFHYF